MSKFFLCTAGTKEKPCHFKCGSTKRWDNHMEFEHNISNATCPPETPFDQNILESDCKDRGKMGKCWGCENEEKLTSLFNRGRGENKYCLSCIELMFSF